MTRRLLLVVSVLALAAAAGAQELDSPPGAALDPAALLLDVVQDRTELSYEERTAYFGMLNHARRVPAAELQQAAAEFVHRRWSESPDLRTPDERDFPLFADMLKRPAEYRGQPVVMQGHIIRLVKYPGDDAYGLGDLYEAWLVPPDSQQHPATVVFTELPAGLSPGEDLIDGVTVSGYFLKLHMYSSRDGKGRVAPLILARTLTVSEPAAPSFPVPVPVIYAGVVMLMSALVFFTWRASRGDRAFQAERRSRLNDASPDDLAGLESLDPPPPPPAPPSE